MLDILVGIIIGAVLLLMFLYAAYWQYRRVLREAKNYERGLKMVPLLIHLPPSSEDTDASGRDVRDIVEETISQAQIMYNIVASTATKGFKSRLYGQRHIAFEIIASKGLIHYYTVVPLVLIDVVRQAVVAAYPAARLEECEEHNIFSTVGKVSGTIGGELTLKKDFSYPIATYQDSKRDAMQAILNALSTLTRDDGAGIQILLRPAREKWTKAALSRASKIRKDKGSSKGSAVSMRDVAEALWKPPENKEIKPEDKQLSTLEQATVDAIEDKTRHPGYEVLIRVIASSNTAARSQAILKNIVAAFALFDAPSKNGFKFSVTKNIEQFITSFIFRFFPQEVSQNVLNSVELATIFHFPDQRNTPTSHLQRQASKQVDGPTQMAEQGLLLGYNVFRGVKKEIRLGDVDKRRHVYIIGQTGTGKSGLLENLALQDMLDGKGFAFLDPHGDSAERLLAMVPKERVEDVIYFSPGDMTETPIGLNLFEFETDDQKDFLIQEAIAMLYRLYDPGHTGIIGPRYEHWFRNAALTIMADPAGASFIDIPQVFNDNEYAKSKLKYVKDQTVLDFWNKEMAQTSDYHKSEVLGWFVSKFGAFLSNAMMRNIIGQTKSGFNLRDIMDNRKILLINISKMGELNAQLMGMIFVMKFQAAAMGRASIPEDQRVDFTLYADEFQNFATESFEIILSQARKYRLSLVLANQFMTQLTDKIREAIIGNVGTVIAGRIGTTDAELMAKKFTPVFDAEDLTKLPNYEAITSVMINNVPSSPFSMSLIPPLGKPNTQLMNALKRLSSAKYGKPRTQVEDAIFTRLRGGTKPAGESVMHGQQAPTASSRSTTQPASGSSFLDEWLAKRKQQLAKQPSTSQPVSHAQPAKSAGVAALPTRAQGSPSSTSTHNRPVNTLRPMHASESPKPPSVATSVPPQTTSSSKPAAPTAKESPDRALGSHLTFGPTLTTQASQVISEQEHNQIERAVENTQQAGRKVDASPLQASQSAVPAPARQQPPTELRLRQAGGEQEAASGLDEIYIDVRGRLHHRSEGNANTAAEDKRA